MAKDAGGKVAFCTINVILLSDNDNAPQFRATKFEVNIGSTFPKGRQSSSPRQWPTGSTHDITYAIEADSESVKENLEINRASGVITAKESFNRLGNEVFTFFVRAVDNGSPQRESVVPSVLKCSHQNTASQIFRAIYTYTVSDVPIGTEIDLIRAEHSGTVLYSLVKEYP